MGSKMPRFDKDPNAVLDYSWDWSDWLTAIAETIATAEVTGDGVTIVSSQIAGTSVVARISGGEVAANRNSDLPTATCRITTSGGQVDDRSIRFAIQER